MAIDLVEKTVLILSDNDGLSRAIALNLNSQLDAKIIRLAPGSLRQQENQVEIGDCDLMVVAMSSPTSEPLLALARASLTEWVGQVPLLIISDRPFESEPDDRIVHLDFPFDVDGLHDKVKEILWAT